MNRLADSTSPYLLQHAGNPVDWWPWCEEAFREARRREVPVLLSVGYAACHWCHVMAHESFEDPETARQMNEHFVCVKVDREERPDIDQVYMAATHALTGQGGWPMTAFLTPHGEPFLCGTYFPRAPLAGMPSFGQLLAGVAEAWRERRQGVAARGREVIEVLSRRVTDEAAATPPGAAQLGEAAARLCASHDPVHGGFGAAPKFPMAMCLEFLLRHHARTGARRAREVVEHTCGKMARGGIYDQLAGGFARYSVDARWVVPHFEKMLYDSALLLRVYLHLWRATGSPLALRVASETAAFLLRDLRTGEGGFASALDADAAGQEGATYVWTPGQLAEALGPGEGAWAARLLAVGPEGTYEGDASVLQLPEDPQDAARWSAARARLLEARAARPQPARDDKVVAAWNGLAIAALAEVGAVLDEPAHVAAAVKCAELLLDAHLVDGRLRRVSRAGRAGAPAGVLEDHGDLAEGLLVLHQVTGEARWLAAAEGLLEVVLAHFTDGEGGFHDTADDAEALVLRPCDPTDNATPSGTSAVAGALLTYAALTGSARHREAAERALRVAGGLGAEQPLFLGWALAVGEAAVAGPLQVAIADAGRGGALARVAWRGTSPGAVVVAGAPDAPGVPLLAGRGLVGGGAAAYVCRGFTCERPITDPGALAAAVGAR